MMLLLLGCADSIPFGDDPEITNLAGDWRDEVIYQVMTDRFANGDINNDTNVTQDPNELARFQGGDWQGLIDHVDYLDALGVTAVWISPVVTNVEEDAGVAGYHGYWTQDFTQPNPHFGDMATLRKLVSVMHEHDIKVIVDIVVNHVGQLFYYDINRNGQPDINAYYSTDGSDTVNLVTEWDPAFDPRGIQSFTSLGESGPAPIEWVDMPELNRIPPVPSEFWNDDWYKKKGRVTDWDDDEQVEEGDFPGGLKDLETLNPNVQNALVEVYTDWIRHTDIDGYRIDTVKHVEPEFWQVFCPAIRQAAAEMGKDRFFLFGEAFDGDDALIGSYTQPGMLDSVAYFSQKYQVMDDVFLRGGDTSAVASLWTQRTTNWGASAQESGVEVAPVDIPVNFLDNHDVPRFLYEGDTARLQVATAFLYTEPGVPVLYYGTEQGFAGGNDPANREPLWTSGYATTGELFQWISGLAALRREHEALRTGATTVVYAQGGVLMYERAADERLLVVLSVGDEEVVTPETSYPPGTTLTEIWPGEGSYTVGEPMTVGAHSAKVYAQ